MLTPYEENLFRQEIKNRTPMQVINPQPPVTTSAAEEKILQAQINSLPKMQVNDPNQDWGIINLVSHTMRKGEALLAWYARTGLGRGQIVNMSKSEISNFVAQAEENSADEARPPYATMNISPDEKPRKRTTILV